MSSQRRKTYAVENHSDCPIRVQSSLVSAELRDLANQEDKTTDEAVEVRRRDARGGELFCHCELTVMDGLMVP